MVKETHNYGGLFFASIALPWINFFLFKDYNFIYKFTLICVILYFVNFGSVLPDIDMKSSYISKRMPLIAKTFGKKCKHRGFTHSLLCIFFIMIALDIILKNADYNIVLVSASIGLLIGYTSHLFLDLFTKEGIEMLYPCKVNFYLLKIKTNSKAEKKIRKVLSFLAVTGILFDFIVILI